MNRYKYTEDVAFARSIGLASAWTKKVHIHLLDNKPLQGVSTIAKESVNKGDGLMQWYGDLAAMAGLKIGMNKEVAEQLEKDYAITKAIQDWKARKKATEALDKKYPLYAYARMAATRSRDDSADKGTDRHGVLESYVHRCIKTNFGRPMPEIILEIQVFINWAMGEVKEFYFTEANCYSEELWAGGICDIGMLLKNGKRVIGDHKSSQNAFFDQFIQAALYDILLSENGGLDKDGNHLFDWKQADGLVIFPFRSSPFTPEYIWNMDEYREVARGVVRTYKLKKTLEA